MTEMTINKLPSKTWYWLHVNETKLPWDKEHTTELPEETVTAGSTEGKTCRKDKPFGGRTCTGASGAAAAHSRKFPCVQSD